MRNIKSGKIVVKIGTNVVTSNNGMLDLNVMQSLVEQIARIKAKGKDVLVITSGAIGAGMKELELSSRPKDVVMQQVCAAIGQGILMSTYHSFFSRHGVKVSQILLTYDVFKNRKTYKNLLNSLNRLLKLGVVPIINENDPISIDEIGHSFGDNDNLSALIAVKMKADLLVILTDVEGLYNKEPTQKNAVLIKEVTDAAKVGRKVSGMSNGLGTGGIKTKLMAAKTATEAGAFVVIANGKTSNILLKIVNNENVGTVFYPK